MNKNKMYRILHALSGGIFTISAIFCRQNDYLIGIYFIVVSIWLVVFAPYFKD